MGLPPGNSKFSGDASPVTTFFWQFPNFTATHTGVTAAVGINSVAGGGTGLATLTANNVILGNGTSSPTFVAPGTSGNVLSSNGTTWVSTTPIGSSAFVVAASSQVTTISSSITSSTFTTFSNSPAFQFTPTISGTYKVYCFLPIEATGGPSDAAARIFNTSGGATLLYESQNCITITAASGTCPTCIQSVYTLTAGTLYQFDIQANNLTTSGVLNRGDLTPFYMFAEGVGLASIASYNVLTITANTTAVSGNTYLCNTSGGAFNLTLPTPVSGAFVKIKDNTGSFSTNNLTIVRHAAENIEGLAASKIIQSNWTAQTFYSNGTDWFLD